MPSTYEPIATTTITSATQFINFSSIPATYTDLRIVILSQTGGDQLVMRFNSDTGSNYSVTTMFGNGSSVNAERGTNLTFLRIGNPGSTATNRFLFEVDIFNYAGSTLKTELTTASLNNAGSSGSVRKTVGLWRSTAAINYVSLFNEALNFTIGDTATLYGIKNA